MDGLFRIQSEHLGRRCSRRERTRGRTGVKSAAELRGSARHRDAAADFVAGDHRSEKPLAVNIPVMPNQRVGGWYRFRPRMNDTDAVEIIHLEAMYQGTVGQGRTGARNLGAIAPDESAFSFAQLLRKRPNDLPPRKRGTKEGAAERID